jgi:hypothetical protein
MTSAAPHELLRCARARRGENLATLSARTGLRVQHIRAIEEGRFGDLPPGIYGRSAIRTFAAAYELDGDAVLAGCEPLLAPVEDPICALARMRGVAPPAAATSVEQARAPSASRPVLMESTWRPVAAATVDGAIAGALVLATCAAAALLTRASFAALGSSVSALFLVGLVLESVYYVSLAGVGGTTFGEYVVGPEPRQRDPRPLTMQAIGLRTFAAATADLRAIYRLGRFARRRFTRAIEARTAPPPAPSLSPPPPPGPEEALTWSMNQRGSVPSPPLRPRHG